MERIRTENVVLRPGFEPGSAALSRSVERPPYMILSVFDLSILPEHQKLDFL